MLASSNGNVEPSGSRRFSRARIAKRVFVAIAITAVLTSGVFFVVTSTRRSLLREIDASGGWVTFRSGRSLDNSESSVIEKLEIELCLRFDAVSELSIVGSCPSFDALAAVDEVEKLTFRLVRGVDWNKLGRFPRVTSLTIDDGRISSETLAIFAQQFPNLRALELRYVDCTSIEFQRLSTLHGLESLEFWCCDGVDDTAISSIATITSLKRLNLVGTFESTGDALKNLLESRSLDELRLWSKHLELIEDREPATAQFLRQCGVVKLIDKSN